jgi:hypothetical protein
MGQNHAVHGFMDAPMFGFTMGRITEANAPVYPNVVFVRMVDPC